MNNKFLPGAVLFIIAFIAGNSSAQTVTGSGAAGRIPVWTGPTTQGNSVITQSAGKIGIGTAAPGGVLEVTSTTGAPAINGSATTNGIGVYGVSNNSIGILGISSTSIGVGGYSPNSYGVLGITAEGLGVYGRGALSSNTTGSNNVAIGVTAGSALSTGSGNICIGASVSGVAGESNTTRIRNIYTKVANGRAVDVNPTTRSAHFSLRAGSRKISSRWTAAAKLSLSSNRSPFVTRKMPILHRRSPLV